jgi:hypothetical protein
MESLGTDVYSYRSEFKFPFLRDLFPVFLYARTGRRVRESYGLTRTGSYVDVEAERKKKKSRTCR